jgi:hypothetical protein
VLAPARLRRLSFGARAPRYLGGQPNRQMLIIRFFIELLLLCCPSALKTFEQRRSGHFFSGYLNFVMDVGLLGDCSIDDWKCGGVRR